MKQGLLEATQLHTLLHALESFGYQVIGPTVEHGTITYDVIDSVDDLPQGMSDTQDKGSYRLTASGTKRYFDFNLGARTWKQFLFSPREVVSKTQSSTQKLQFIPMKHEPHKKAFLGVRACEISGIQIQDKVFLENTYPDPSYKAKRENSLIIGINCSKTTHTCFCVSMNTGPEITQGYDLLLSEIENESEHYFIVEVGSDSGQAIFDKLPLTKAIDKDFDAKRSMIKNVEQSMGRTLDTTNIKETLYEHHNHSHWEEVAKRCVSCGNCTLACPTCFCSTTKTESSLDGTSSLQVREWDSCFSQNLSYVHESYVRDSTQSRYRQWMTHKLASWIDQFGTSGCVGCGKCITWCPVGIDITEEYKQIKK